MTQGALAMNNKSQLTVIFITVFIYLAGFGIIIPILPLLARDFGASPVQVGLVMTVYSLMQFIFAPVWGRLSDRLGRRPILLFCLIGEGLSYILFAMSRDFYFLLFARGLAGFFGASISTASAYISDITPPDQRSKGMALIGAAFGLGFIVGPALGGALAMWGESINSAPHFGTSFAALWVAALCIANFIFALSKLKESLPKELRHDKLDKPGRIQLILKHISQPLLGSLIIVFFLASLAMSSMEATLVLYTGDKFGWTIKEMSFGFAYLGIIMVLTQGFLVRKIIPILGEKLVLLIGLSLFVTGMITIALSDSIAILAVAMTFLSVGQGLLNPSSLGSISLIANASEQGVVLGVTQSLASLGRIFGPLMGGFLYANLKEGPYFASGLLGFIGLILVIYNFKRLPNAGKIAKT
jgi:MFS transporter, DHA1 family, tetracycline resistance protein